MAGLPTPHSLDQWNGALASRSGLAKEQPQPMVPQCLWVWSSQCLQLGKTRQELDQCPYTKEVWDPASHWVSEITYLGICHWVVRGSIPTLCSKFILMKLKKKKSHIFFFSSIKVFILDSADQAREEGMKRGRHQNSKTSINPSFRV